MDCIMRKESSSSMSSFDSSSSFSQHPSSDIFRSNIISIKENGERKSKRKRRFSSSQYPISMKNKCCFDAMGISRTINHSFVDDDDGGSASAYSMRESRANDDPKTIEKEEREKDYWSSRVRCHASLEQEIWGRMVQWTSWRTIDIGLDDWLINDVQWAGKTMSAYRPVSCRQTWRSRAGLRLSLSIIRIE